MIGCWCHLKEAVRKWDEEEHIAVLEDSLTSKYNEVMGTIKKDGLGAVASDDPTVTDGYFLVLWHTDTYTLQEPTEVFGWDGPMEAGNVVVEGTIYHRLHGCPYWHQPPDYTGPSMPRDLFWIGHIVKGDVVCRKAKENGENKFMPPRFMILPRPTRTTPLEQIHFWFR